MHCSGELRQRDQLGTEDAIWFLTCDYTVCWLACIVLDVAFIKIITWKPKTNKQTNHNITVISNWAAVKTVKCYRQGVVSPYRVWGSTELTCHLNQSCEINNSSRPDILLWEIRNLQNSCVMINNESMCMYIYMSHKPSILGKTLSRNLPDLVHASCWLQWKGEWQRTLSL